MPSVTVRNPPRMGDFARLLAAIGPALGVGAEDAIAAFHENQQHVTEHLEDDPLVRLIEATIDRRGKVRDGFRVVETTAFEFAGLLEDERQTSIGLGIGKDVMPKSPLALTHWLRRRAPQMRKLGFVLDLDGHSGRDSTKRRCWRIGYQTNGDGGDNRGRSEENANPAARNATTNRSSRPPKISAWTARNRAQNFDHGNHGNREVGFTATRTRAGLAMTAAQVAQFLLELVKLGAVLVAAKDPVAEIHRHRRSAEAKAQADVAWTQRLNAR